MDVELIRRKRAREEAFTSPFPRGVSPSICESPTCHGSTPHSGSQSASSLARRVIRLGTPKDRVGKTQRTRTATKIAETFFDPISDLGQKGKLLDEVVLIVAGQAESDKMRLALACLDSLVRFEEVMHADTHLDYNNSKEVSGAHMATLPQKGLKLDSEYSRFTGLDHKKFGKLRERLDNPSDYRMSTGMFEHKPRGYAKSKFEAKEHAVGYWNENAQPRMLGSGARPRVCSILLSLELATCSNFNSILTSDLPFNCML